MTARLDQVVVAVPDVAEAARRWTEAGLPAVIGGRHPGGTVNALVRGPGTAYVELIGVAPDAEGPWADRVRGRHGPLSWAVAVDDIEAARASLLDAGFTPGEVQDGARTTPAGTRLTWRLCDIGEQPFDPELPFLIQWVDGMQAGPSDGAQLTHVTVTPSDPERVVRALRALGMPSSGNFPDSLFGIEGGWVLVEAGRGGFSRLEIDSAEPASTARSAPTSRLDGVSVHIAPGVRGRRGWPVLQRVEELWARSDAPQWPDPMAGRTEPDPSWYSRCVDPARYRVLGLRVDAWIEALADLGLASSRDLPLDTLPPRDGIPWSRITKVEPAVDGAVPLWLCRRGFEGLADNGVVVHVGEDPEFSAMLPDCGCDACDDGSARLLQALDAQFLTVIEGGALIVTGPNGVVRRTLDGWSGIGPIGPGLAERWLRAADSGRPPHGTTAVVGAPWR
jgi:hypothetical protein